ncbi:similar to light-inducible protein ATLS1-like [Cyanidioschyzon merolae strain 10D]|jgi:phenylpyruvate tautomerase|uniref:L-dopachrome isomerase n=1 Tax=Cyanidioschyzon merolae (strain NIES-3377 / 10D) TaxID=280699 RepID=M1VMH3_CYAM1|nr:similar to light-inducible protein ATLS1-like [Cyanidioschyzon merolae strain 10D]BAM83228.1 similar to light-inducible protein ATLS1-like [Cyanidioschyzon merolae strain 10D]|eukprot:XP_005539264.1 similar to light-inducible protein ATLS1-like [Cyanidioschyzon merolae strain 10D]
MPAFTIKCNVELSKEKATALCKEASKVMADILGKPESFVTVTYEVPLAMTWDGNEEPAAVCMLLSLGTSSPEHNVKVSAKVAELLRKHCGVQPSRYYVEFVDPPRSDLGWNGRTFA